MLCPSCGSTVSEQDTRCQTCAHLLQPGLPGASQLQGGKYTVGKMLGRGGFGITYLGANTLLGMPVAIKELFLEGSSRGVTHKVIPSNALTFQEEVHRFMQESRVLAQFNHPSIVRVLDLFEENGTCYLVMELLRGQTLTQKIHLARGLGAEETLDVAWKLLEGLDVVHRAGLLHRDIKPDNIVLTDDGRVVLIDFGTARTFQADQTSTHTRLVTPGYAPLEQYASRAKVGPYTDLYALGATLYHALLGEAPPAATDRMTGEDLQSLPLPADHPLALLIHHTLKIAVQERPQSVQVLRSALLNGGLPQPPQAPPAPAEAPGEQFRRAVRLLEQDARANLQEAVALLTAAAHAGHADAQCELGLMHWDGRVGQQDHQQAVFWYRKAAQQGHVIAQHNLGWMLHNGHGVQQNHKDAAVWFRKAAEQGNASAQNWVGLLFERGEGVEQDDRQAVFWYHQAAAQGESWAQHNLGCAYENGRGVGQDHRQAVTWYQKAAQQGHAPAQHNLALMYREGKGARQDDREAALWFRKAAEQGYASAQNWLGLLLERGQGVVQDPGQAVYWYHKAAEQGEPWGQHNLALMYRDGRGVQQHDGEAVFWLRKAAEQGHASAQNNLGLMHHQGRGVQRDDGQAVYWYHKAAEQGEPWGQHNLALMYRDGQGVSRDLTLARHWYALAARQGHQPAQRELDRLNRKKLFGIF